MADFDAITEQMLVGAAHAPVRGQGVELAFVEGPNRGAVVRIAELAHRRALVGSSAACEIRLDDRTVSRRHASLELEEGGLRVLDLGSRNGVYVGGVRVRDALLISGNEFVVGATRIRVAIGGEERDIAAWQTGKFGRVLGASPAMRRLYPVLERLASQSTPALIEGEAGTGKELLAESIHEASPTPDAPFVVFEPASVAPEAIEQELFGLRGDVHGAGGLIQAARGGTLFLDEVSDLPTPSQLKLLRVLEHDARGSNAGGTPRVRIIASTRRDLDREVQDRRFREDLLTALATVRVELPPLRKRTGDIALLTHHFWAALGGAPGELPADLVQRFEQHEWPGNVRELQAAVGRAIVTGERDVGAKKRGAGGGADAIAELIDRGLPLPRARQEIVLELERRYTQAMLDRHGGSVGKAAAASGIGRRYFQAIRAKK